MENKELLKGLADNQPLFDAVKALLISHFERDEIKPDMTDEQIGQITRARVSGIEKLNKAFKEINDSRSLSEKKVVHNPAR